MQPYRSRAESKLLGVSQYFTGLPCKNGHTTYRYTASGACSGCIRASNSKVIDENATQKRAAKAELVQARFRLFNVDRDAFAAAAWATAVMRYPMLTQGDVDPRLLPKDQDASAGMYAYYCHPEDLAGLRKLAGDMVNQRCRETADAVLKSVSFVANINQYLPPDTTPPMNFK